MPTNKSSTKTPPKRSLAQRMRDRTSDLDTAEEYMSSGRKSPSVGGAYAPKKMPKKK